MNFYGGGNNLRKIIEAVYVHIKQSKTSGYPTLPVLNIVLIEAIFIFQGTLSLFSNPHMLLAYSITVNQVQRRLICSQLLSHTLPRPWHCLG